MPLLRRVEERAAAGEIRIDTSVLLSESTWLALRASGTKLNETPVDAKALLEELP